MTEHRIEYSQNEAAYTATIERQAVRAIVRRGGGLLMVYSQQVGDYKFPGGGIEAGESHEQALAREIREECGYTMLSFGERLFRIFEEKPDKFKPDIRFCMVSDYYACTVGEECLALKLDDYEAKLGFRPVWISVRAALQANRQLVATRPEQAPVWIRRDTWMLEQLL